MDPFQITPELIQQFGNPHNLRVLDTIFTNFSYGQPGWLLAREFGTAGVLGNAKAQTKATELVRKHGWNIPITDWQEIAIMEGLGEMVSFVPDVQSRINQLPTIARFDSIVWDQPTVDCVSFMLKCVRDSGLISTCYPLLEGEPGASKTQAAMILAMLIKRPVYTVVGGDGASDEIKAMLMGGPYPSDKAPWAIAKDYAYMGVLKSPASKIKFIHLLQKYGSFEGIPQPDFQSLAESEGIREGITYDKKGAYQLANEHGGILLLEECNSFPAEVHSLLTQILESYSNKTHPNFIVIGTQNPAGEKHPSRNPLPPEVVNRFERYRVPAPKADQYVSFLKFMLTGEQPTVKFSNGTTGEVTPRMLGYDVPPRQPHMLAAHLSRESLNKFAVNISHFHKNLETQIHRGTLNPQETQEPNTRETTFVSRRNLKRFIHGVQSELQTSTLNFNATPGQLVPWDITALTQVNPTDAQIVDAITSALDRYYVIPHTYDTNQVLETKDAKKGKGASATRLTSTKEQLMVMLAEHHLTKEHMQSYIVSITSSKDLEVKLKASYYKFLDDTNERIKAQSEKDKTTPILVSDKLWSPLLKQFKKLTPHQQKNSAFIPAGTKAGERVLTMVYSLAPNPFYHAETTQPLLTQDSKSTDIGENVAAFFVKRSAELLSTQGLHYPTTQELITWLRPFISQCRKEEEIYVIPSYNVVEERAPDKSLTGKHVRVLSLTTSAHVNCLEASSNPHPSGYHTVIYALSPRTNAHGLLATSIIDSLKKGTRMDQAQQIIQLKQSSKARVGLLEIVKIDPDAIMGA